MDPWQREWVDYYAELDLPPTALTSVIQAAYRALAKEFHPDTGRHPDGERMKRINAARDVLTDPSRRTRYDVSYRNQARRDEPAASDKAPPESSTGSNSDSSKRNPPPNESAKSEAGADADTTPPKASAESDPGPATNSPPPEDVPAGPSPAEVTTATLFASFVRRRSRWLAVLTAVALCVVVIVATQFGGAPNEPPRTPTAPLSESMPTPPMTLSLVKPSPTVDSSISAPAAAASLESTARPTAVPTPTTMPTPTATPIPTPTSTPVPTPTPTPVPKPPGGTVIYHADWSNGNDGWVGSRDGSAPLSGWSVMGNQLLADGSDDGKYAFAPLEPDVDAFEIDADIQLVHPDQADGGFAINFRQGAGGGYTIIFDIGNNNWSLGTIFTRRSADDAPLIEGPFLFDGEWHRYTVKVEGNRYTVLRDNQALGSVTDNTILGTGSVALWSYRTQLSVKDFYIVKL